MSILETKNLKYTYPDGTTAINNVDIEINKGKKIAFVGRNGSGKSTLFLLLNGTLEPDDGKILYHDEPIKYDSKSLREIRKNVGIVFQNPDDQIFAPTIYQDVGFGPTNLGYSKDEVDEVVNSTLEYMGLKHLKDKPPHHLSGGQKKRVAIAGVVAMDPEVVILDEPLSNLDPVGADELLDLLNEYNHFGKTIIISTHNVDLAYKWADYVYLMSNSEVINEGTPDDALSDSNALKKAALTQPTYLEIYHELMIRGLAHNHRAPKDIPELVDTLKPLDLMWVNVPPETKVGDYLNLGVMYGEYAEHSPYEAVNARVLHIHENNMAIVEFDRHGFRAGGIMLYDMDKYEPDEFGELIKDADIEVIGAMGKKSKSIAEDEGIPLSITTNVIDRSILTALCGKRCLILTNGGMVDHALKRINDYAENSGIELHVGILNRRY
jgi:cobalt/nickel transport system ATP-binding protein